MSRCRAGNDVDVCIPAKGPNRNDAGVPMMGGETEGVETEAVVDEMGAEAEAEAEGDGEDAIDAE